MKLRHSARTDVGKTRDHNEDNYGIGSGERVEQLGELLVVCDGMGGHAAGEVASKIAVDTILDDYYADTGEDRPQALATAFKQANASIYARGQGSMGTTGVAALLHHDAVHIANVGDSRAYLIRDGEIRQVSRDHSFVSDQVAAGLITADQARLSPHRNVITRALGYQPDVSVDLFRLPLQIGDIVVLCSDGMHGLVLDEEIFETVTTLDPDLAVQRLIDLANIRGGTDNITVVLAQIEALDWYSVETTELSEDEPHEPATAELPVTGPQPAIAEPVQLAATTPANPAPRPRPLLERRLSMLGGVLALALLIVLIGIIVFAMNTTPVLAPSPSGVPAASTAGPTQPSSSTSAATSQPGASPTSAATSQPGASPTPGATAAASATAPAATP